MGMPVSTSAPGPSTFTQAANVAAATDNSGGAAADGTIGVVTPPTALTDNGGGTADNTVASQAAPTTLTDNTGLSGSHDDTLAATSAPVTLTDSTGQSGTHDDTLAATTVAALTATALGDLVATQNTGWGASTEAGFDSISTKFDALLADVTAMRALDLVITQNASDAGQKIIELVTLSGVLAQNDSDMAQKIIELVTLAGTARDNLKELTTAQAANRTAIVALTDAVAELAAKLNAEIAALKAAGLQASA